MRKLITSVALPDCSTFFPSLASPKSIIYAAFKTENCYLPADVSPCFIDSCMIAVWEPEDIIRCKYTVPSGARCTALSTKEVQPVNFSGLETQAIITFSESQRGEQQQQKKMIQEFRK